MRAEATVAVERVEGRTVHRELRSDPPLSVRATVDGVHLVGSGAGPLGGDDLRLAVSVGEGAALRLASVAASLAQPGPSGAPSWMRTRAELAAGAELVLCPEPTLLVQGCDHRSTTHARVGADARLLWRDQVVLGRHREPSGSVLQRLDVELEGRPLVRTEVALGPRWPGAAGPAGAGPARSVGSMLLVGPGWCHPAVGAAALALDDPEAGLRVAALELEGDGVLVSVVAATSSLAGDALAHLSAVAAGRVGAPGPDHADRRTGPPGPRQVDW